MVHYIGTAAVAILILALSKHVIDEIVGEPAAASLSPPAPIVEEAKPALVSLKYQICGALVPNSRTNRLSSFEFEIDPINPNAEPVSYIYKSWHVEFGGRAGKVDAGEGWTIELAPQATITSGVTAQPATRVSVPFDPPIDAPRIMTGKYNFQFRYGPDEDNMNIPGHMSGTISAAFDSNGQPTAIPYLRREAEKIWLLTQSHVT